MSLTFDASARKGEREIQIQKADGEVGPRFGAHVQEGIKKESKKGRGSALNSPSGLTLQWAVGSGGGLGEAKPTIAIDGEGCAVASVRGEHNRRNQTDAGGIDPTPSPHLLAPSVADVASSYSFVCYFFLLSLSWPLVPFALLDAVRVCLPNAVFHTVT